MADSDEEYDRRRRDKFRRERNDYERRDDRRRDSWDHDRSFSARSREVWSSRNRENNKRDVYGRDYDSRRRDRYSPPRHDISPPQMKRIRRDWDDTNYSHYDVPYGAGGPLHTGPPHHGWGPGPDIAMPPQQQPGPYGTSLGQNRIEVDYPTQPPMLTFKQFLSQQDDGISDQEAIKKYNDYKMEFKRQQISEFFLAHKEEEWFKSKYHPEECSRRQQEMRDALKSRLEIFLELMLNGRVDACSVDVDKSEELIKILDAAVIKLEGGDDADLRALDDPDHSEKEEGSRSRNNSETQVLEKRIEEEPVIGKVSPSIKHHKTPEQYSPEEKKKKKEKKEFKEPKEMKEPKQQDAAAPDTPLELPISKEQEELQRKAQEFSKQQQQQVDEADETDEKKDKKKKRHRDKTEYSYESGSETESGSGSEPEPAPPGVEDEPTPPGVVGLVEETRDVPIEEMDETEEEKLGSKKEAEENEEKEIDTAEEDEHHSKQEISLKPRALHKTCSIFLRNLAPAITKQEVEATCRRYSGFLRVALQDPQPERRFFRRGWVTFERNVNIKEICWNLNNIRLRDCELGAIVNRELKQRVRPVHGITAHKQVVKQDIKQAAKIIQNLDSKWKLWEDPEDEKRDMEKESTSYGLVSKNPVLKNITDYLVEEGSYEEEELLGENVDDKPKDAAVEIHLERDDSLCSVLDRMILYLRIVHSLDYYSASEYPNEDEMPHRCGIIHGRGPPPSNKIMQNDVTEWSTNFDTKIKPFVELQDQLEPEEAVKLGKKDTNLEVNKFVTLNTQELDKNKWLCPLSGKKFKGPEFVKKHIFNKHAEKIEEVKKEVTFFNNYLLDPKRPQLPEHPGNKQQSGSGTVSTCVSPNNYQGLTQQGMMGYSQPRPPLMYGGAGPPGNPFGSPQYGRESYRHDVYRRPGFGKPYRYRRSDPRSIIEYRDLDAPEDMDIL